MRAGLESHVKRRSASPVTCLPDRLDFRVGFAEPGVEALADHLVVRHDDRADKRIRMRLSPPAPGEIDRSTHPGDIPGTGDAHSARDSNTDPSPARISPQSNPPAARTPTSVSTSSNLSSGTTTIIPIPMFRVS